MTYSKSLRSIICSVLILFCTTQQSFAMLQTPRSNGCCTRRAMTLAAVGISALILVATLGQVNLGSTEGMISVQPSQEKATFSWDATEVIQAVNAYRAAFGPRSIANKDSQYAHAKRAEAELRKLLDPKHPQAVIADAKLNGEVREFPMRLPLAAVLETFWISKLNSTNATIRTEAIEILHFLKEEDLLSLGGIATLKTVTSHAQNIA